MKNLEKAAENFSDTYWKNLQDYEKKSCFAAGAEYVINKCYDQERKQELFDYLSSEFGYTVLDEQMNDIIHILTKD